MSATRILVATLIIWGVPGHGNQDEGSSLVLPVQTPRNWKPATVSDFSCNHPPQWEPDTPYFLMDSRMMARREPIEIRGWFCFKNKWVTTCSTNFVFSKTVHHQVTHAPVTKAECKEAAAKQRQGKSDPNTFPDPSCAWMSSTDKEIQYTHLIPHTVQYDPRSNRLTSPAFPRGVCDDLDWCETVTAGRWWLPETDIEIKKQVDHQLETVTLKLYPVGSPKKHLELTEQVIVSGTRFPPTDFTGSCKWKILGEVGVVLPSGIWISIPSKETSLVKRGIVTSMKVIPTKLLTYVENRICKEGDHKVVPSMEAPFYKLQLSTLHYIQYQFCLESLDRFVNNQVMTRMDLSRFAPRVPGLGKVYIIRNGRVEVGTVLYERCRMLNDENMKGDEIGRTEDEAGRMTKSVTWTDWVPGPNGVLNGPNGIFKKGGKIYHPQGYYQDLETDAELLLTHSLLVIPHPMVEHFEEPPAVASTTLNGETTTLRLNSEFHPFWSNFHWITDLKDKIVLGVILTLSILITLGVSFWFLRFRTRGTSPSYR
ncbi:glycoprotein [Tupavirus incomtus]|uniref:Glycoprotein n=1 Tax=Tupavirus sp. TaxID=2809944 RepID=A0AAE9ZZP4_9RHAB|nr:glycoprotein [Tupavirus sp.]